MSKLHHYTCVGVEGGPLFSPCFDDCNLSFLKKTERHALEYSGTLSTEKIKLGAHRFATKIDNTLKAPVVQISFSFSWLISI